MLCVLSIKLATVVITAKAVAAGINGCSQLDWRSNSLSYLVAATMGSTRPACYSYCCSTHRPTKQVARKTRCCCTCSLSTTAAVVVVGLRTADGSASLIEVARRHDGTLCPRATSNDPNSYRISTDSMQWHFLYDWSHYHY